MTICSSGTSAGRIKNSSATIAWVRGTTNMNLKIWSKSVPTWELIFSISCSWHNTHWIRSRLRSPWSSRESTSTPFSTTSSRTSCSCTRTSKISTASRLKRDTRPFKGLGRHRVRIDSTVPALTLLNRRRTFSRSIRSIAISKRRGLSRSCKRLSSLWAMAGTLRPTQTGSTMRISFARWTNSDRTLTSTTTCWWVRHLGWCL